MASAPWEARMLRALLLWTALLSGVLVWLPLVRGATQGAAYRWAFGGGIGGQGMRGDYWLLLVGFGFVLALLFLGWRGARWPFHALLLLFQLPLAAAAAHRAWTSPRDFVFEGATLGVRFSLVPVAALFGGFALLAVLWTWRDLRRAQQRPPVP